MQCLAAAVLLLAACGRAPAKHPLSNRAHAVVHPVCEEHTAELAKQLRARWSIPDLRVRCAAGNFGAPGFFVEARAHGFHRTGIVSADGAPDIAAFSDVGDIPATTEVVEYAAADLDGDGVDEVIETWRRTRSARDTNTWLVVRRLVGNKLRPIRGPHLGVSHPELGACSASWHCAAGTIVITVDAQHGIPPSDCLPTGIHRFVIRHGALVERR